jgi:hypothetical protein
VKRYCMVYAIFSPFFFKKKKKIIKLKTNNLLSNINCKINIIKRVPFIGRRLQYERI